MKTFGDYLIRAATTNMLIMIAVFLCLSLYKPTGQIEQADPAGYPNSLIKKHNCGPGTYTGIPTHAILNDRLVARYVGKAETDKALNNRHENVVAYCR